MVDALRNVWRVLVDGGILLDLRPLPAKYHLDLVTPASAIRIGHTDTTGRLEDDAAADAAVAQAVEEGLFASRIRVEFDVEIFWESVSDLQCYVAARKSTRVSPTFEELEQAFRRTAAESTVRPRLRASRRLMLGVFDRRTERRH